MPWCSPVPSARLEDFSDLEILMTVADLGGDTEPVTTNMVAVRLFGSPAKEAPTKGKCNQSMGCRLAWLKQVGLLDKGKQESTWVVSEMGNTLRKARLAKWRTEAIGELSEDHSLHVAALVGASILKSGDCFRSMERTLRHYVIRRKKS